MTGKRICVDFFIPSCWDGVFAGDCRNFSADAHYAKSRVQLYINPDTRAWEVKYNCTMIVIPHVTIEAACDSATVFNPSTDVTVETQPNGTVRLTTHFKNNACAYFQGLPCPAIDATIDLVPNATKTGGFDVFWNRDGFPSMGVYNRNAANTAFETMKEDPAKTRVLLGALWALIGQNRSIHAPPLENPNSCAIY